MTVRKPFRFFLLKLIFPLTYAGFFIVQLFINFDSPLSRFSDRYQIIHCQNGISHPVAVEKAKDSKPVKTRFRLNKRFQPAVIAALADIQCEPIVLFVSFQHAIYANPYIKRLISDTRSLRGPPFAVWFIPSQPIYLFNYRQWIVFPAEEISVCL